MPGRRLVTRTRIPDHARIRHTLSRRRAAGGFSPVRSRSPRPHGFRDDGTPVSLSFIGRLYGEAETLAVAKAYQDATDFHTRRPPRFA